jgi:hypothetical protein
MSMNLGQLWIQMDSKSLKIHFNQSSSSSTQRGEGASDMMNSLQLYIVVASLLSSKLVCQVYIYQTHSNILNRSLD